MRAYTMPWRTPTNRPDVHCDWKFVCRHYSFITSVVKRDLCIAYILPPRTCGMAADSHEGRWYATTGSHVIAYSWSCKVMYT